MMMVGAARITSALLRAGHTLQIACLGIDVIHICQSHAQKLLLEASHFSSNIVCRKPVLYHDAMFEF